MRPTLGSLYAYGLAPVLAVSLLLFFTAAFRGRAAWGLAAYCLAVALWSGSLLGVCLPSIADTAERFVAGGAFIAAAFLHVAYDVTRQPRYGLVGFAYAVALGITALGAAVPGALYGPRAMVRGPLFWPALVLAIVAAAVPAIVLVQGWAGCDRVERRRRGEVLLAGLVCASGGIGNAVLLSSGRRQPFGTLLVLASLLLLGHIIRALDPPAERRLLERSLLYAAITAFVSAGFMLGVSSLMSSTAEPLVAEYRLGAWFLLALAVLAFEPLRRQLLERLAVRLIASATPAVGVARALEATEEKAERAERLAEIGTLVSAVAHEVRNPIGVLSAHVKLLERRGEDPETVAAMREQLERASRFVDDLLRFGRPRPLEPRRLALRPTLELALSTARQGLGVEAPSIDVEWPDRGAPATLEADQAQLGQLFVILFDNALLALCEGDTGRPARLRITTGAMAEGDVRVTIEDSGPGLPEALQARLFQPFVTGRKREGPRPGTGLGLATARRIVERHGGRIEAGASEALGGARLEIVLPARPPTPGESPRGAPA
jgi:signal transduction histidine kinase